MRTFVYTFLFFSLLISQAYTQLHPIQRPSSRQSSAKPVEAPPMDKVSYAMGAAIATQVNIKGVKIDENKFIEGFKDVLAGKTDKMSEQERNTLLINFKQYQTQKHQEDLAKKTIENAKEEKEFLTENQKKPDIITLPSGLQYKVVDAGQGTKPTDKDNVTFIYRTYTPNGKEIVIGTTPGEPITAPLSQLIPAWKEALKLMGVGATWEVYSPSQLAFGTRGIPPMVGPNQMMVFKMTLKDIKPQENSTKETTEQ